MSFADEKWALVAVAWHTRVMVRAKIGTGDHPDTSTPIERRRRIRRGDRLDVQAPRRSVVRYAAARLVARMVTRLYSRVRVEGSSALPAGPFVLCFSHQNWADPLYLVPSIPRSARIFFFGPEQDDMRRGFRNRMMRWVGVAIPYRPGKRGLISATARAHALIRGGAIVAIAGEGRIHAGEGVVLPLQAGPAYLALRAGVPVVPIAVNGTTWLGFRRVVRLRVGAPILTSIRTPSRPTGAEVAGLIGRIQAALETLVADFEDQPPPGPIGQWVTELFNLWPEGSRPAIPPR
jgi:1-acyl-sn-glycerol-3-phosphate acyltransferase